MKTIRMILVAAVVMLMQTTVFSQKQETASGKIRKDTPVKSIEHIVGSWKATGVYNGKKAIGTDTTGMQWLKFAPDGKYTAQSKSKPTESGSYRLNENQSRLYLETRDSKDPIEWTISFKGNTMTLQSMVGHDKGQEVTYVFVKTKEGLSTNQ